MLDQLPLLCVQELLLVLDSVHDVVSLARTCKRLAHVVANDVGVWRDRCERDFGERNGDRATYVAMFPIYGPYSAFFARMRRAARAVFGVSLPNVTEAEILSVNRTAFFRGAAPREWLLRPPQARALALLSPTRQHMQRNRASSFGLVHFYNEVVHHWPVAFHDDAEDAADDDGEPPPLGPAVTNLCIVDRDTAAVSMPFRNSYTTRGKPVVRMFASPLEMIETMAARVESGIIGMETLGTTSIMSLVPQSGPTVQTATSSDGIRISASPLPVIRLSQFPDVLFVYEITIEGAPHCTHVWRLTTRHWLIVDSTGKVDRVDGPGVIGEFPVVKAGSKFRYRSCVSMSVRVLPGRMSGHFNFVRVDGDSSSEVHAAVPAFALEQQDVVFLNRD